MASEPPANDAFLREVDEELRRDQLLGFWQRWGRWLVGGTIALLAAWAAWIWWDARRVEAAGTDGEQLLQAFDALEAGNTGAGETELAKLKDSKVSGYRAASRLALAAIAAQKNDVAGAAKLYDQVTGDADLAEAWRNLALVRQTALEFDTLAPDKVIARLKPIAVKGNPWFGSAGELTALAHLKAGQPQQAERLFKSLTADEAVPESIRTRAAQMETAIAAGTFAAPAAAPAKEAQK